MKVFPSVPTFRNRSTSLGRNLPKISYTFGSLRFLLLMPGFLALAPAFIPAIVG